MEIEKALKKDKNYKIIFISTLESGRVRIADLTAINMVCCDAIKANFEYGLIINKSKKNIIDKINQEGGLSPYLTTLRKQPFQTIMLTRDDRMDEENNVYFEKEDENRKKLIDFINNLPASNIRKENVNKIDVSNFEEKIEEMERRYTKAMAEQEARYKQERAELETRMEKDREEHQAEVRKIQQQMEESQQAAEAEIEKERKETEGKIDKIRQENEERQRTLEAALLQTRDKNFKKRLIKSPKLYFYDTGLACSLLGIHDTNSLAWHPLQGSLFENFIISELMKRHYNRGLNPNFYFWRESNGIEIDCLIERGNELFPIEIKSTQTFSSSFPTNNLKKVASIMDDGYHKVRSFLIYGGEYTVTNQGVEVISWKNLDLLI